MNTIGTLILTLLMKYFTQINLNMTLSIFILLYFSTHYKTLEKIQRKNI